MPGILNFNIIIMMVKTILLVLVAFGLSRQKVSYILKNVYY